MDFFTIGEKFYIGYVHNLYVTYDIETLKDKSSKDYYKIIHIQSGTNHIAINGTRFILTGAYTLYLNEEDDIKFYSLSENTVTILFFKPSVINTNLNYDVCNTGNTTSVTDMQDSGFLSGFKHNVKLSSKIIQLSAIDSSIILQKLQNIYNQITLQNTCSWPCRSRAYLMEILFSLERLAEDEETYDPAIILPSFTKLSIDTIYYLQTHYNEKLTVEKLAQALCTNRTTLLSDFKKSTGVSINQYLTQLRIKIASMLLRDTELAVAEICDRTGFSDIGYFSKSFKKEIKYTPSEYRHINTNQAG